MCGSMYVYCVKVCIYMYMGCVCMCACMCVCVHSSGGHLPADLPVELGSEEKQGWRLPAGLDHRAANCAVARSFHVRHTHIHGREVTFHL